MLQNREGIEDVLFKETSKSEETLIKRKSRKQARSLITSILNNRFNQEFMNSITETDIDQIKHLCLSSGKKKRRERALMAIAVIEEFQEIKEKGKLKSQDEIVHVEDNLDEQDFEVDILENDDRSSQEDTSKVTEEEWQEYFSKLNTEPEISIFEVSATVARHSLKTHQLDTSLKFG